MPTIARMRSRNITCKKCRHRHPPSRSCAEAAQLAAEAAAKRKSAEPQPPDDWEVLTSLIQDFADASIAESWKGGGDPADVPELEMTLELARMKLNRHMERMRERWE